MRFLRILISVSILFALGACNLSKTPQKGGLGGSGDAIAAEPNAVDALADVLPSVVEVRVTGATGEPSGIGSGVILRDNGLTVTNNHVVANAASLQVRLTTGRLVSARLLGTDPYVDLAVIDLEGEGYPSARLGTSANLRVGEYVFSVGSPFGLETSVSHGIVSGLHRNVPVQQEGAALVDLIQSDAPISPGNSGGALVDTGGNIVGINVAYLPPQEGAVALGFAIPVDTVKTELDDLAAGKPVRHAFLGVQVQAVTAALAREYNLGVDQGALVVVTVEGGPAAKAGIREGDVLLEAGGRRLEDPSDLVAALKNRRPGEVVEVVFARKGEQKKVNAELASRAD